MFVIVKNTKRYIKMDKTVPCNSVNAGNLIFIQCIFTIFSEFCPTYTHSDF